MVFHRAKQPKFHLLRAADSRRAGSGSVRGRASVLFRRAAEPLSAIDDDKLFLVPSGSDYTRRQQGNRLAVHRTDRFARAVCERIWRGRVYQQPRHANVFTFAAIRDKYRNG